MLVCSCLGLWKKRLAKRARERPLYHVIAVAKFESGYTDYTVSDSFIQYRRFGAEIHPKHTMSIDSEPSSETLQLYR